VTYHSSPKFMEIDIDIGSSTVANNIVRFVLGYVDVQLNRRFQRLLRSTFSQLCSNSRGWHVLLDRGKRWRRVTGASAAIWIQVVADTWYILFDKERLIGTSRIAHLEPGAAVAPPPIVWTKLCRVLVTGRDRSLSSVPRDRQGLRGFIRTASDYFITSF